MSVILCPLVVEVKNTILTLRSRGSLHGKRMAIYSQGYTSFYSGNGDQIDMPKKALQKKENKIIDVDAIRKSGY